MMKCVTEHSGPTVVWIVTLLTQVSFSEQSRHEIAFLSLQNMAGRQGDIYPDSGVEKLSEVRVEWIVETHHSK